MATSSVSLGLKVAYIGSSCTSVLNCVPVALISAPSCTRLLLSRPANGARITADQTPHDFVPVVKLFTPDPGAIWLLTELDPDDADTAFGLCDLGLGCPELGYADGVDHRARAARPAG